MRSDFRTRVFVPLVLPLATLAVMALLILSFAAILLWNDKGTALVLAATAAAGILLAIALLASRDGEEASAPKKGVVGLAAATPFVLGALTAAGVFGGVVDVDRNINRVPHLVIPEDAPVITASNSLDFDTDSIDLPAEGEVAFIFDNQDPTGHNVFITAQKADGTADLNSASYIFTGKTFGGPASQGFRFEAPGEGAYAFFCAVHPSMQGTVTFTPDAEHGAA